MTLPELRRLPRSSSLRALRVGRGDRCVLAIEDGSTYGVLSVLEMASALTGASLLQVAHPDLRLERLSRTRAATAFGPLAAASAAGQAAVLRARRDLKRLAAEPREPLPFPAEPAALLYVNPNLWFGLKVGGSVGTSRVS